MSTSPIATNETAVLVLADAQSQLQALVEQEPLLQSLLELAALQGPYARWHSYEAIKHLAYPLVGLGARSESEAMRSPSALSTFMHAVDALLPEEVR